MATTAGFPDPEWLRRLREMQKILAPHQEVMRAIQEAQRKQYPELKRAMVEAQRGSKFESDLHAALKPLQAGPSQKFLSELDRHLKAAVPPEVVEQLQSAVARPLIPPDVIRGLQQQQQFREQFRSIAEQLEAMNDLASTAAEEAQAEAPDEPAEVKEGGWLGRLHPTVLFILSWWAVTVNDEISALMAEVGSGDAKAILERAARATLAAAAAIASARRGRDK